MTWQQNEDHAKLFREASKPPPSRSARTRFPRAASLQTDDTRSTYKAVRAHNWNQCRMVRHSPLIRVVGSGEAAFRGFTLATCPSPKSGVGLGQTILLAGQLRKGKAEEILDFVTIRANPSAFPIPQNATVGANYQGLGSTLKPNNSA